MNLSALSDQELMASLRAVCADSRRLLVKLLLHLNEVEARRLDAKAACPSLYEFCIRRLGMSDGETCRRVAAARLIKRFPNLIPRIESGALNLSTMYLLRDQFNESNCEELADAASGRTKFEVQELIARMSPKPDVPPAVVELPAPALVLPTMSAVGSALPAPRVVPLAENRYEIHFTGDRALRDKIERAKDLLRHRHPKGDLEAIMNRAFDVLLVQLEKERLGAAEHPRKNPKPLTSGGVSRSVRREVFARDGQQCTYADQEGNRCPAKGGLELDHIESKALGGEATASNLRVRCRKHNRLHAEEVFGAAHIAMKIDQRQHGSTANHLGAEEVVTESIVDGLDQRQHGWPPQQRRVEANPAGRMDQCQHGWPATFEPAQCGLLNMGFGAKEVRRVLDRLAHSHAKTPIETLLREAIMPLTPARV